MGGRRLKNGIPPLGNPSGFQHPRCRGDHAARHAPLAHRTEYRGVIEPAALPDIDSLEELLRIVGGTHSAIDGVIDAALAAI